MIWMVLGVGVYLLGWVLAVRPALRRWMLTEVCDKCRLGTSSHGSTHRQEKPRGSISDRNGRDAAGAIWCAAWWPLRLLVRGIAFLLWTIGRRVGTAVLSGELTAPELERRIREQEAKIARLSEQIEAEGTAR